jgi:hypothetical protein
MTSADDSIDKYVWVVVGATGSYDSYYEWNTIAFHEGGTAIRLCNLLIETYDKNQCKAKCFEEMIALDPNFADDDGGVSYFVKRIKLGD